MLSWFHMTVCANLGVILKLGSIFLLHIEMYKDICQMIPANAFLQ